MSPLSLHQCLRYLRPCVRSARLGIQVTTAQTFRDSGPGTAQSHRLLRRETEGGGQGAGEREEGAQRSSERAVRGAECGVTGVASIQLIPRWGIGCRAELSGPTFSILSPAARSDMTWPGTHHQQLGGCPRTSLPGSVRNIITIQQLKGGQSRSITDCFNLNSNYGIVLYTWLLAITYRKTVATATIRIIIIIGIF